MSFIWERLSENFQYAWAYLWSGRTFAIVLGILFAIAAIAFLIASRTHWGRTKPLTKCIIFSVLAHVWLLIYAGSPRVVLPQGDPNGAKNSVAVSLDALRNEAAGPVAQLMPDAVESVPDGASTNPIASVWDKVVDTSSISPIDVMQDAPAEPGLSADDLLSAYEPTPLPELPTDAPLATAPPIDQRFTDLLLPADATQSPPASETDPILPPPAPQRDGLGSLVSASNPSASSLLNSSPKLPMPVEAPPEYQLRQSADRLELAKPFGADQDTEAAVSSALMWLAKAQSNDGAWVAKQFGGGTETYALGENRNGTGDRADTGVTGLALLAFLSGGHTHQQGDHQATVRLGLEYLIRSQMYSGDLSGPKQVGNDASVTNARMYCHGIATLALAEAYAMTHDPALRDALTRAVNYTLNAQDRRGGGWRYRSGDAGDLSQFGWQAMALRSVERSGIRIESEVKQRMRLFLDSCSAGQYGGLARYRPHEGAPSPTMTAESLACRLLLNHRSNAAAQTEATQYIMAHLPGSSEENVYYWYYATLALFQLQDQNWRHWNQAMKSYLLTKQKPPYDEAAGSWDPDPLWGGYGGRVYSTAMSCLCLEVYYRYLPLYNQR